MTQSGSGRCRKLGLASALAICEALAFCGDYALSQIKSDDTFKAESSVVTSKLINGQPAHQIDGGAIRGANLFHSFEVFSVPTGGTAYFNNALDIQNIISRVTGGSVSNINGLIRANGNANLFLLNPNGIIFGPNASLKIGGSFLASTASSLKFADNTKFSAIRPQTTPLLTVSVPIGLQFGATAAPIRNQSQVRPDGTNISSRPVGLQVQPGKTLALVGGELVLEGGSLTAAGGRIELGSVVSNSMVSLNPTNQGWILGYSGVQNFQDIKLTKQSEIPSYINASGAGSGNIQLSGRRVLLIGGSRILANTRTQPGGNLTVSAKESVELIGFPTSLSTLTTGTGQGGDLTITTGKLIVRDGAQVYTSTIDSGAAGQLTVYAKESVDLIGNPVPNSNNSASNGLFSTTVAAGNAGNITITTGRLRIKDGAELSAGSSGVKGLSNEYTPATGFGGNLTVNASKFVELTGTSPNGSPSSIIARTRGPGDAGRVIINTGQLIVRDRAAITVSSEAPKNVIYIGDAQNLGKAGELNVTARDLRLDNQGKLTSETDTGQGGNITLLLQDLLLMRHNSQISTSAGKVQAVGNGGNIFINAPNGFIVAKPEENSDITANAFTGSGGSVQINTTSLFGIVPRSREDLARLLKVNNPFEIDPQNLPSSDITAISQTNPNLSGVVNINTQNFDPNRGVINLPTEIVEPKLASGCTAGVAQNQSQFIITGRGGLPPNPREVLRSHTVQVDWVSLDRDAKNPTGDFQSKNPQRHFIREQNRQNANYVNPPTQIVEAQGWIVDNNGDVILVATAPTTTPHSPTFNPADCSQGSTKP